MAYTKNTWKTDDIITADKLNHMESGIDQQDTREAVFTDFATVAADMTTYSGNWFITAPKPIANSPYKNAFGVVEVISGNEKASGLIIFAPYYPSDGYIYYNLVTANGLNAWRKTAIDSAVVHNTGTETVAGNKTFTGNTNFAGQTTLTTGNYGLRVTTTGIQKTSDGGTTWVNI